MSNFKCNQCNKEIIENEQGVYVTGCEHYPVDECNCDDYNGYVCARCRRQQANMTVADYEKDFWGVDNYDELNNILEFKED